MSNKSRSRNKEDDEQSSTSSHEESGKTDSFNQLSGMHHIDGASGVTNHNGYTSSSNMDTNLASPQYSLTRYTYNAPSHPTYSHCKNSNHGQCGLENLGNTCFMNSILQCLINILPFSQHYRDLSYRSSLSNNKHPVSTAFANLIESMRTSYTVQPIALKNTLRQHAPQLLDFSQQDSHEFLTLLLDVLHRESSTQAEEDSEAPSIITELFQGQMQYTIKCSAASRCKNITITIDPFLDVPVFIDDQVIPTTPSTIFKARFFLIDGQKKLIHFPYSSKDTIQSIIDYLQKTLHSFRRSIIVMKVSADNTYSAQYRPFVPLSQIDDQSTIFYEIDDSNTNAVTMCLFMEKSRSSLNQIYNWPPVLLKLPEFGSEYRLRSYLNNHFDSSNLGYEISEDPFIYTIPTYQSSSQKTILIHIDEKIIRQAQSKLESQPTKRTGQTRQESSVTLEQCLTDNISVIERMSSNSTWFCPNCQQNRQLTKENRILSLPQVLIIHLKRFNMKSSSRTKIETFVKYPLELNMNMFLSSATSEKEYMYNLIGVCLHSGSFERGHYTAYIKKSSGWFCCNDSFVEPISVNDIVHRNAYILFYSRRYH